MSPASPELIRLEESKLKEMRDAAWYLGSPNNELMYSAAQTLSMYTVNRTLLPTAMSLLAADDIFVRRIVVRTAVRNLYGDYVSEFFSSLSHIPPAEVAQILQSAKEAFKENGRPPTSSEQKIWIKSLEKLGREHQPGVVELMAFLGSPGVRWVTKLIRERIQDISIGTIASLREFPEKTRTSIISLLCNAASKKKRDLLPYIGGLVDSKTVKYLKPFLTSGDWQERREVANAVGGAGITTSSGLVRDILNDPDWRVKQALADGIDISKSKFTSLLRILEILIADSHSRVKRSAGRTLLRIGLEPCEKLNLDTQRDKLMKRFREQLLKAAPSNKDLDTSWLGVDLADQEPIPFMESIDSKDDAKPQPVGISDFADSTKETVTDASSGSLDLRSALLKKMLETREETAPSTVVEEPEQIEDASSDASAIDSGLAPPARFLALMDQLSKTLGKALPLIILKMKAPEIEMSAEEFDEVLNQLVKEGTVYMVDEETVRRADILTE